MRGVKTFFLTVLFIVLFSGVVVSVYCTCDKYFGVAAADSTKAAEIIEEYKKETALVIGSQETEHTELNIIIAKEPDENMVTGAVIVGRMNIWNDELVLVAFPDDTRITLTSEGYSEITALAPAMPQIFEVRNVFAGIGSAERAGLLKMIFKDYLELRIDAVFVLSEEEFERWFIIDSQGVPVLTDYAKELSGKTAVAKNTYFIIEQLYVNEKVETNTKFSEMINYLEFFEKLTVTDIDITMATGIKKNEYFVPDTAAIRRKLFSQSTADKY